MNLLFYRRSFADSLRRFYLHCVKDFISFFNSTYPVENIRSNWTKLIRGPSKLEQSGFFFILKFAHRNSIKKEKVSINGNRKHSVFFISFICSFTSWSMFLYNEVKFRIFSDVWGLSDVSYWNGIITVNNLSWQH